MEKKDRVYFAHPVNVYDTDLEKELLKLIQDFFGPGVEIENPNQPHHQVGYKTWKEKYKDHPTKSGMTYFYEIVLPGCNMCVCQVFLDGKWGAGVANEAAFYIKKGQPVWMIEPKTHKIRLLTVQERDLIVKNDPILVLSIEETRCRTWGRGEPYKNKVPYEQSHLV